MPEGKASKLNFILLGNIYFEFSFAHYQIKMNIFAGKRTLCDCSTPVIRRQSQHRYECLKVSVLISIADGVCAPPSCPQVPFTGPGHSPYFCVRLLLRTVAPETFRQPALSEGAASPTPVCTRVRACTHTRTHKVETPPASSLNCSFADDQLFDSFKSRKLIPCLQAGPTQWGNLQVVCRIWGGIHLKLQPFLDSLLPFPVPPPLINHLP